MSDNKLPLNKLTFSNLALLMNSTDHGKLMSPGQSKSLCIGGGFRVTDGKHVHIMKFLGMLLETYHKKKPFLPNLSPKPHRTKKALPDRRNEDGLTWFDSVQKPTKFDRDTQGIFLNHFAMTGRKKHSAMQAGVCSATVKKHLKDDPIFKKAHDEAWEYYKDHIHEIHTDHFSGIAEPIMGGKNRKEIVGWKTVIPANNLLAMELKRTNPEYNEKTEVDMNVSGGVLVAPANMSFDEYTKKFVKQIDEGDKIVDVERDEVE